jgi:hypothetical protein
MKQVVVLLMVCGAVAACSFRSHTTVEQPVAPATATVVTTDAPPPPPPPAAVIVH